MNWHPLLTLPGRVLAPLLLAVLALAAAGTNYVAQLHNFARDTEVDERLRLRERLNLEQGRLEQALADGNLPQVHRLVLGLGLNEGITHAWLLDRDNRIVGALTRLELEQPLAQVLQHQSVPLREQTQTLLRKAGAALHIQHMGVEPALLGQLQLQPAHRLVVRVDLSGPLAERVHAGQIEVWREVGMTLVLSALLALLLHVLWFRRAAQLTATVQALGRGQLDARAQLTGHDELAQIGGAIDGMAGHLGTQQTQLRELADLVAHSPIVGMIWHNTAGWPLRFVSESVRQWGYAPEALLNASLAYADLVHPEDLPRIEAEVTHYIAHGPDDYRQEYRLRHASGHWVWIEDHTWLTRGADGTVSTIQGVLLDISSRHAAEEAQRQTLQSLDTMANASPVLMWTSGLDGGCDWFNRSWLAFTGRSLEEERGSGWAAGVHPEDHARCLDTYRGAFEARQPFSMEYRLRRHDGEYRWLLDQGQPRNDADGVFVGYIGSCLDITAEVQLTETLRASERRLTSLISNLPGVVFRSGIVPPWPILYASDAVENLTGYTPDDFLSGRIRMEQLAHPQDSRSVARTVLAAVVSGRPYSVEYRLYARDGQEKWIWEQGSLTTDATGQQYLEGFLADISARKQAQTEVQRQIERLQRAEAHARLGSWELNLQTCQGWWSPQMFSFFDLDPSDGVPSWDVFLARLDPQDQPRVQAMLDGIRAGRMPEVSLLRSHPARGPARWFSPTLQGKLDEQARISSVSGTLMDITAIHEAQASLRELNASLEARVVERTEALQVLNQSLESFVYAVSHDLKAPLRGVDGYSRLLQEDHAGRLDAEGQLFVGYIRQGVQRMNQLIDDLLAYSRMERRHLDVAPVDVTALVTGLLAERGEACGLAGARVEVCTGALQLRTDAGGLATVLRNLLDNALKFSAGRAGQHIEIGGRAHEDHVTLWVRDNGPGFDMKYHDRIFEIFQRLHRQEDYPGTGVGLALVKKAMQRMGGRVWAESAPGQGATFYLEFPA